MIKKLSIVAAFAAVAALTSVASAEEPGGASSPLAHSGGSTTFPRKGQLVIGAERMTGFYSSNLNTKQPNAQNVVIEREYSSTNLNLLWNAPVGVVGTTEPTSRVSALLPALIPRLGVDYLLTDLISLGGSVGYISRSGSAKVGGVSTDAPSYSGFAIAPRVGFAIRLTDSFAFWPRVGISYYSDKSESKATAANGQVTTSTTTSSLMEVVGDLQFVFSPIANFGFTFGPIVEYGLSGSSKTDVKAPNGTTITSPDTDLKLTTFGITTGIIGYF